MAVIVKDIFLEGSKGKRKVAAVFDSGSTYSCITPELAERLGMVEPLPGPMDFGTAERARKVTARQTIRLNFYIDEYRFSDEFMVVSDLSEDTIIGAKTLQAWRFKLDFENNEVIIDPRVTKLRLLSSRPAAS